jgi:hypothetical protein
MDVNVGDGIEIVSDKAERIIFLLFAIFMAVFLYLEG